MKSRYIVLTDINRGIEIDDIQSLVRLLMYSDVIDIEGLISCTSCFVKKTGKRQNSIIHKHIDAYNRVKPMLDIHSGGYPTADYLHSITKCGIPVFGEKAGRDFATEKYNDNEGVRLILDALDKNDDRPIWFGLWGGANTLAQALWMIKKYQPDDAAEIFSKVRIYNISDQDYASKWLRREYGSELTIIATPSDWTSKGSRDYYKATWPGISADRFEHGCEDGVHRTKGFKGADYSLVCNRWNIKNIRRQGALGRRYSLTHFITEGDTPAFLGLIENGLNDPAHIEYGGWGGRYISRNVDGEAHPFYSDAVDTVTGNDGKLHSSPQATIWRWREDFQRDFAARMKWCVCSFEECLHPADISPCPTDISAARGERISLSVNAASPDKSALDYSWFHYAEAGGNDFTLKLNAVGNTAEFTAPDNACSIHIIVRVTASAEFSPVSYRRFIITVV